MTSSTPSRFIAGSTVSQVGNWVNVTAVMVFLQEQHGAAAVAAYFLLRTALPYLCSRLLVTATRNRSTARWWASAQLVLAMLMVGVAVWPSTVVVLVVVTLAAVLQSAASAWMMQLVHETVAPERRPSTITAISTGTSVALVAGPALGGALSLAGGLSLVFLFDAATFLAAIALVPWRVREQAAERASTNRSVFSMPDGLPRSWQSRMLVAAWVLFGLFGGLLNSIETPVFVTVQHLDAQGVGLAIGAYGLGGLVVFVAATFAKRSTTSLATAIVLVFGVALWAFSSGWLVYLAFFIAGLGYSLLNGALRARFDALFGESSHPVAELWAWIYQLSLLTSVVTYLAMLAYFSVTPELGGPITATLSLGLLLVIAAIVSQRSPRSLRPPAPPG